MSDAPLSYASAGVSIDAGNELVDEIKYQQGLADKAAREYVVMEENLTAALSALEEYLRLAPTDELKAARNAMTPAPTK